MGAVDDLAGAWRALCQGPGIQRPDLHNRIPNALADATGISRTDGDREARTKLQEQLTDLTPRLSESTAQLINVALAIPKDYRHTTLSGRLSRLESDVKLSSRTLLRRLDGAMQLLAEQQLEAAAGKDPNREDDWYLSSLTTVLRIDGDRLTLMETRELTALRDGVQEIEIAWSSARPMGMENAANMGVQIVFGGVIDQGSVQTSGVRWRGRMRLSRQLAAGETAEYCTLVEDMAAAQPYYLVTPTRRIDRFEARVKFPTDKVPSQIYRLDGVFARFAEEIPAEEYRVMPDSIGEVVAQFTALRRGRSYGVRWVD